VKSLIDCSENLGIASGWLFQKPNGDLRMMNSFANEFYAYLPPNHLWGGSILVWARHGSDAEWLWSQSVLQEMSNHTSHQHWH
jgi:hypothetical protein